MRFCTCLTLFLSLILFTDNLKAQLSSTIRDDIGLTQLRAENPMLSEGVGIKAHLVEAYNPAGSDRYVPNPADAQISSNRIDIVGFPSTATLSAITSGHALTSARNFFGANGVARDLGKDDFSIDAYAASGRENPNDNTPTIDWVNNLVSNFGRDPVISAFDRSTVSSHSYIFQNTAANRAAAPGLLRRLDYLIAESDTSVVVGSSNGGSLPPAWVPSYNAIAVGRSDGGHGRGLTTLYGAGRVAIDVVVPTSTTSRATPVVAGAVAILQDAADGSDAARSEVIRATILAGATKDSGDIAGTWSRSTSRPLDSTYGAGELNIHNSYNIQQGGEFDGSVSDPATAINSMGWDYESSLAIGNERLYEIEIGAGSIWEDLSIALTWNMDIVDLDDSSSIFDPEEQLANLTLELFDSSDGFLDTRLDFSDSDVDNVEHIYVPGSLTAGTYHLRISNAASDSFATDYGLAWRASVVAVPEPFTGTGLLLCGCVFLARRRRD